MTQLFETRYGGGTMDSFVTMIASQFAEESANNSAGQANGHE